jgi:hypothetical protein
VKLYPRRFPKPIVLFFDKIHIELPFEIAWLIKRKTWFRAFFIPTIPTATHYLLRGHETELEVEISHEDFNRLKPLAELNRQVMEDVISDEVYQSRREDLGYG